MFRANRKVIEEFARKKYLAGQTNRRRSRSPRFPWLGFTGERRVEKEKNKKLRAEGRQEMSHFHATYWSTSTGEFAG